MEKLTDSEIATIKCCIRAEIRLQEEALKDYTSNSLLDKTAREDIGLDIERLKTIIKKLGG